MADEETQVEGVEEPQGTAPEKEGVPTGGEPTAQPPAPVNLDDLPDFREYRSQSDRKLAEAQGREKALREENQRRAQTVQQLQNQLYQAEIAGQPDDYSRLQVQLKHAQQQVADSQGRATQAEERAQAIIAKEEYITGRVAKFKREFGFDISKEDLMRAETAADAEGMIISRLREAQEEQRKEHAAAERARAGTDNVDVGGGPPTSPSSNEEFKRATKNKKLGDSLSILIANAQGR